MAKAFNSVVAARTRAASQVLNTAELLEKYVTLGGQRGELEKIVQHGNEAEALNHAQGFSNADGKVATQRVLLAFEALKAEYAQLMSVLRALRVDFIVGGQKDVAKKLEQIIADEAQTQFVDEARDGVTKRKARKRRSQEAVRAEILRDAEGLLAFEAVAERLSARRFDRPRLEQLKADAKALSGKLADRAATKGSRRAATEQEGEAVTAQRLYWGAAYGLLRRLAAQDGRVSALLAETAR